jgi:hypothetical protein
MPKYRVTPAAQRAGREVVRARAAAEAADLAPIVKDIQAGGITSLNGIAAALNERGVLTPAGSGHWYAMQVARVLKRLRR